MTAFFVWLALRDAPFGEVGRAIAHADWLELFGFSMPAYLLLVYLRALRWRHLTDPIAPIAIGPLFRATSVGFMANNVFPLRVGEVVRCWYLSRETRASGTALLGTVILERVIDTVTLIALAFGVLAVWGAGGDGAIEQGAYLLLPVAIAPTLGLVWLRVAPDQVIRLGTRLLRPVSERLAGLLERSLRRFSAGLGALRGGTHLFWIAFHSVVIWMLASPLPLWIAVRALDVDLGSVQQTLAAIWITQAAIGVAVAVPSAPGFFGPYHFASKVALERFGVPAETALAVGTVSHAVFWITLTLFGLLVLRTRQTSLGEIDRATTPPDAPLDR